jgi:hypothetical protein
MMDRPGYPPELVLLGMSLRRRIGNVVAGLGGLAGVVMIGMLWATEPAPLPVRTRLAFAALMVVGAAWTGFAGWALARRPLFALDRVVAGVLAVVFSTLTTVATTVVALTRGSTTGVLAALGTGSVLVAVAVGALVRARAHRRMLLARKGELERSLGAPSAADGLPIGPLALAMRHRRGNDRRVAVVALVVGAALVVGVALLWL